MGSYASAIFFLTHHITRYRCLRFPKLCALLEKAMRKFSIESSLYLYSKFILRHHFESRVNRRALHCDLSPAESTLFRSCSNFHAIYQRFSARAIYWRAMRLQCMRSTVAADWKAGAQVTFIKELLHLKFVITKSHWILNSRTTGKLKKYALVIKGSVSAEI